MTPKIAIEIHSLFLKHYKIDFNIQLIAQEYPSFSLENDLSLEGFLNILTDTGGHAHLSYIRNSFNRNEISYFIRNLHYPILVFALENNKKTTPILITEEDGEPIQIVYSESGIEKLNLTNIETLSNKLIHSSYMNALATDNESDFLVITCTPINSIFTEEQSDEKETNKKNESISPVSRLLKVLQSEKKEISYIYIYAFFASVLSLSLPIGIQAIIGFVSSGRIPTSAIVLIVFIILGIFVAGMVQLMQINLVEHIQQRLFVKTAFDFAYRIPKFKIEAVLKYYTPELTNRFFDIISLQKGLAKILTEFTTALIQVLLGLLLLTFYHSSFIVFGIVLVIILVAILRLTAAKGLKTSLYESKYKYQMANWLQEIARALSTFKLAGYSTLPMEKTDYYLSQYLHSRKDHFKILTIQYVSFILFKTLITGGLLILGCILLVEKEINIGQFVASEIVIILVMNAVEKLIVKLDVVYDVLTSIEKIGTVMDLPIENAKGINIDNMNLRENFSIELRNLKYKFPNESSYVLKDISLKIEHGERICIAGYAASGKTTLINIILGFLSSYEGVVSINGLTMKDINKNSLINHVGDNVSQEDLFDGTLLENITLGRNGISMDDVIWATESIDLNEFIQSLPNGFHSRLIGGNMSIPQSIAKKIIVARSIVMKPKLLILEDFLAGIEKSKRIKILDFLLGKKQNWTVIVVSNEEEIMKRCDNIFLLKEGRIIAKGPYTEISNNTHLLELI